MKIIMIETKKGSNDGSKIKTFIEGETYVTPFQISEELAELFIKQLKVAKVVKPKKVEYETKVITPAETKVEMPEIKSKRSSRKKKK